MADVDVFVYPNSADATGLVDEARAGLRTALDAVVDRTSVRGYDLTTWGGAYPGIDAGSADEYRPVFEDWLFNSADGPGDPADGCHLAVSTDFDDGQAETGNGEGIGEDGFLMAKTAIAGGSGSDTDWFRTLVVHEVLHSFVDDRLVVSDVQYDPTLDEHALGTVTGDGDVTPVAASYREPATVGHCSSDASKSGRTRVPSACTCRGVESTFDDARGTWCEARSLAVDDPWATYALSRSLADPVVFAKPLSYTGSQPAHVRLAAGGKGAAEFHCRVEEWRYLDGAHYRESVGSLAVDTGHRWTDDYGSRLEANYVRGVDEHWTEVPFHGPFEEPPVILAQSQTVEGGHPIVTRVRNVGEHSFEVRVQEEEAEGPHRGETVGWLAVEPGAGRMCGARFEAGVARDRVDEDWATVGFDREYADPVFLADMQTTRGPNTCGLRRNDLSRASVALKVEEERSADGEVAHRTEDVGYLVMEPAGH